MASLGAASLDGASVVGRLVALSAEGAPGVFCWALGGDAARRAALVLSLCVCARVRVFQSFVSCYMQPEGP